MIRKPDPLAGIVVGGAMAIPACLVALLIYLLKGSAPFDQYGLTLMDVLLIYAFGGVAGGALGGSLLPLATWRIGAVLLGGLSAVPMFFAIAMLSGRPSVFALLMSSGLLGGVVGYGLWTPPPACERGHDV